MSEIKKGLFQQKYLPAADRSYFVSDVSDVIIRAEDKETVLPFIGTSLIGPGNRRRECGKSKRAESMTAL